MAIKVGSGKLPEAEPLLRNLEGHMERAQYALLAIAVDHVRAEGLMSNDHRDPFDRLLAPQAATEGMTLVTADPKVQALGAPWMW